MTNSFIDDKNFSSMPGLVVGEGRRPTRDNCRILRPYILWKRRKEQLAERALFMKVKHEEEQRKREEEERKCAEREKKLSRIEVRRICCSLFLLIC